MTVRPFEATDGALALEVTRQRSEIIAKCACFFSFSVNLPELRLRALKVRLLEESELSDEASVDATEGFAAKREVSAGY